MQRQIIERLLPAAYQRAVTPGSVLATLLEVMEGMLEPDDALLETVDELFAPYRTTDRLVAFLAGWVALDHLRPETGAIISAGRLRNLVAEGALLAQWRGTRWGLRRFLEVATGVSGFGIEEPQQPRFHFVITVPPAAAGDLDLIRRIVEHEKPAPTTYEIRLTGEEHRS